MFENQFDIMETILGIKGPDFVMLAADCTQAHSIITLKEGKRIEYELLDFVYMNVRHRRSVGIHNLTNRRRMIRQKILIHSI